MPRRVAWLFEEDDTETPLEAVQVGGGSGLGDSWFLGTFGGHVEDGRDADPVFVKGLTLDAALAWAREQADGVVIRIGSGEHYAIGMPGEKLPEPPEDLASRVVRRRFEGEEWKDRRPDDPPIAWTVEAAASLAFEHNGRLLEDAEAVDAEAAQLIAALAPDRWSAEPVAQYREFLREMGRRAEAGEDAGWFVGDLESHWRLWFTVQAPTRELAVADVKARAAVPPGWELFARATPADAGA